MTPFREVARRLLVGVGLSLALMAGAIAVPLVILLSRRGTDAEAGSAASCLLNALTGGPRTATFSAWSWEIFLRGKPLSLLRLRAVDAVNFETDHCRIAWLSHERRGLLRAAALPE
jgi:hypothetical protein